MTELTIGKGTIDGRIYLSSPHLAGTEAALVADALASNWIAPLGPHVDAFEREFAARVGVDDAVALSSGTAALHLALLLAGVGAGDEVFASTLTFAATVNPILYLGASPVFIDSERASWTMDPVLLESALDRYARFGRTPKAVVVAHLYGQSADLDPILESCRARGVTVIEDAAEALGTTYHGCAPGTLGHVGIFSFNGNKIITSSGGGMLVSHDHDLLVHARKLATQARDPMPHYEHSEIGYNYRMSNILAALGRAQLGVLEERVRARRANFAIYQRSLCHLPGITFMPEASWGRHTRWLTTLTIDPAEFGATREDLRLALDRENIEARPVWKPMHMQPVFASYDSVGGAVSEDLFRNGICLPSGSNMTTEEISRVVEVVHAVAAAHARPRRTQIRGVSRAVTPVITSVPTPVAPPALPPAAAAAATMVTPAAALPPRSARVPLVRTTRASTRRDALPDLRRDTPDIPAARVAQDARTAGDERD